MPTSIAQLSSDAYPADLQPGETDRFTHSRSGFNPILYPVHEASRQVQKAWFQACSHSLTWVQAGTSLTRLLGNPEPMVQYGRDLAGATQEFCQLMAKDYGQPSFNIKSTTINGQRVRVRERVVAQSPFCDLIHFRRRVRRNDPKVLVVAPLSGHYATLLRSTVKRLLPEHDVYITNWKNAREVPIEAGDFGIDHYVTHVKFFLEQVGPKANIVAVCQPTVPVLAAVALMAEDRSLVEPSSMVLMGGPIDTEAATSQVTDLAEDNAIQLFEQGLIGVVPAHYPGAGRKVFPGFVALGSFLSMNPFRHAQSYLDIWTNRFLGDHAKADKGVRFYDEYNAVLDNYGRFYLETVQEVFKDEDLAKGQMRHFGRPVEPAYITRTGLLTVEGGRDDISPPGQTTAAHKLCSGLEPSWKFHHLEADAGHYGIFSGSKWRQRIAPQVTTFIRAMGLRNGLNYDPPEVMLEPNPYRSE